MAAIRNPIALNKLWKQSNDRLGPKEPKKGEKPKGNEAIALKQSQDVTQRLKDLKTAAQAGVKTPAQAAKFDAVCAKVMAALAKYCKTLKAAKDDGFQDLKKFRKNVRQITVIVGELSAANADTAEDASADLNDLQAVDDSNLDRALEDPKLTADEDEAVAAEPPPAPADLAAQYNQRRKELEPMLLQALKEQRGDTGKLRAVFAFCQEKAGAGQVAVALKGLEQMDKLLKAAAAGAPAAPPDRAASMKAWQAELKKVIQDLKTASDKIKALKDPDAGPVALALLSIAKQLPPAPNTPALLANVESYLKSDDVIVAAEECPAQLGTIKIREPLLRALAGLKG